jgi:hypothetical protein
MAMDQNVCYIDVNSGVVKGSHHTVFDESWYLQPSCPPAAQLLYELGLQDKKDDAPILLLTQIPQLHTPHVCLPINPTSLPYHLRLFTFISFSGN